jgi:signal transduction histidine kinase
MRISLLYKLLGAFLLVILIGALVISFLTTQATQSAFNLYTTRSSKVWGQRLAPVLASYYAQNKSWQGVETVWQTLFGAQVFPEGVKNGLGGGPVMGMGMGRQNSPGMMGMVGQRLIVVDENKKVVSDTLGEMIGTQISESEVSKGVAITLEEKTIGTLIVVSNDATGPNTPAGDFISSVNRAIISSVTIASLIAIILGTLLFFQIISPLRQLKTAAASIAAGDLSQKVVIKSQDELGELGQTFNQMAENLAKMEIQRRHMVADVAHELRTPLAAIQGTLEGIQDGVLPMDDEQISALYTETMLLNRLVGDLKLLSLAEAGQLKLECQEIEPGVLLQQIVERAKAQAEQKNINLFCELDAELPEVSLDSDRITQVLNNLIGNALRYTPAGGRVTVKAGYLPAKRAIHVSVTDTGSGIPSAELPYVFDRFYRADKSRTRSSGGSGLGLAIVKQLVEAHGGEVSAESPVFYDQNQQGFGTKILFTLPVVI